MIRSLDEIFNVQYLNFLTDRDRLRVQVKTRPDSRPTYSIQLECLFSTDEGWTPVFRADDFHDRPHYDILSPRGGKKKAWLPDRMDNKANMKEGLSYLLENWEKQRERYERELDQRRVATDGGC